MNERSEACRIARNLAEKHGGRSSQYMDVAWEMVRNNRERNIDFDDEDEDEEYDEDEDYEYRGRGYHKPKRKKGFGLLGKLARVAVRGTQNTVKVQKNNWNMFKAPKDSPSDVFSGFNKLVTKRPEKIDIPPHVQEAVKKELKRMFKFW